MVGTPWMPRSVMLVIALAVAFSLLAAPEALAHVKWFCAFDVAGQPRGLENVLCPDFEELVGVSLAALAFGCLVEGTLIGNALLRVLDRISLPIHVNSELLVRAVCGAFFVALWVSGGILLTPELKTASPLVPWLQLAIAVGLLWRHTLPFSAIGIAILYLTAALDYGVFHLMDYPIFLGIAAYLAMIGLDRAPWGIRPLDVLRYTAAVTLMWASVEKWAYPEWTFPLLIKHPDLAMGFDSEFFLRAAGAVEFALAFALAWTPLVRRVAAIILASMFISAVLEFGKIDAIGHAPIIAVMLAIIGDTTRRVSFRRPLLCVPFGYAGALVAFLALYYVMHSILFGTTIV